MDPLTLKDKTAIVGVGHTEYSRDSGRSEMNLAVEAIRNAIADAWPQTEHRRHRNTRWIIIVRSICLEPRYSGAAFLRRG